jgi:Rieske Fe-S protein
MKTPRFLPVIEPDVSRRGLLGLIALASASVACGATSSSKTGGGDDAGDDTDPPPDDTTPPDDAGDCTSTPGVDRGAVTDFPAGSWKLLASARMIIGCDGGGLFAFSAVCTHSGCIIGKPSATNGATVCPCHGARFDGNGAVTAGPARSPLVHYEVNVCGGRVYVNTGSTVPAATRTAV